jgi:hypothetical protein
MGWTEGCHEQGRGGQEEEAEWSGCRGVGVAISSAADSPSPQRFNELYIMGH